MDKKQIAKRYMCIFLALIMLIGIMPANIFAANFRFVSGKPKISQSKETQQKSYKENVLNQEQDLSTEGGSAANASKWSTTIRG